MKYGLLGPLRIVDGDRELLLPRQKHRALLAVLLLHARETMSIDRLIDELWGERPPATAKNSLHNFVSHLRKLLGADVLRTEPEGYVLDVEPGNVDVPEFERLLDAARTQAAPEQASTLQRALDLWRGPALAGLEYEPFAIEAAPRLERLREEAQEELVAAELELGRHSELVPRIEELVARHPLRERLREQLMLALYRAGRQAEALTAYQDARRTLVDELGVEPGPGLRSVEAAILRQDAALSADATPTRVEPRPADLRERRSTVTVLSAEVTARTELDAELHDRLMRRTFNELRAATEYHGGTVERLAGDELLALFGVPERHEDDALRAARAALQIRRTTGATAELEVRVALETGEVIAPGPAVRAPVAGAPVSRARRLAEAAPAGEVVVSESTLELLRDGVVAEPLAELLLRGGTEPVSVCRLEAIDDGAAVDRFARAPLVGRHDELETLRDAFDGVVASAQSAVVTVLGDAGVGKTRLAAELVRALDERANVVVGRCASYGAGATWLPLREIAQTADAAVEADVAQTIEMLLSGGAVTVADAFWSVRQLLEAAARDKPALVVLEDLHWATPTFLDFVAQLAETPVDARVLVLCLGRPELAVERSLELEPLSEAQTAQLVDAAAEDAVPETARAKIAELAEGNPLFAEQLVAYVRERGPGALGSVPPTVEALLASRLDRLDAEARGVLQRAAVVGREFWQAAVLDITPRVEVPAVGRHLGELERKGLIRAARSSSEREDAFRFHHALIRDVAYASLPKSERAELHEAVADWLDAADGADDAIVGFHLEQAYRLHTEVGDTGRRVRGLAEAACERLGSAGILAWKRCDAPTASNLLVRATAIAPETDAMRAELLSELGVAQRMTGDLATAHETLAEAVAVATDERRELRARLELTGLQLFANVDGTPDALLDLASSAIPVFERADDDRSLGRAWLLVGYVHGGLRCENAPWLDAAERALDHYRRAGWPTFACAGEIAAALFHGPTPANDAVGRCNRLLADSVGDRAARATVAAMTAGLEAMRGRESMARRLLVEARRTYDELGQSIASANNWAPTAAEVELNAGNPQVAEAILAESCDVLTRFGEWLYLTNRAAELADVLYVQRRYDEAETWAGVAQEHAAPDDVAAAFSWRSIRSKLLARRGDLPAADSLSAEALALVERTDARNQHAKVLADRAEILRLAQDDTAAKACAEKALALYEQKGNAVAARRLRKALDSAPVA